MMEDSQGDKQRPVWSLSALKEYIERIFEEKQTAIDAALVSVNERLKILNELRSGVAKMDQLNALEKRLEIIEKNQEALAQQKLGRGAVIAYSLAAITLLGMIIVLANMYLE